MDTPQVIKNSRLYRQLDVDRELLTAVLSLREVASHLADTISRTVPAFTDHTVRHMDALWGVADHVLTAAEAEALSTGEAFLLACGFYLHDIGMAYAATEAGLNRMRRSSEYAALIARAPESVRDDPSFQATALAYAIRARHAGVASELVAEPIPGTDIYLLDSRSVREAWADTCGKVAASHHWSLETLERELGATRIVPLPGGRQGDIGYAASLLRVIDYAHINRDRARTIDRIFRGPMERESLIHWLAQENIDGPTRDGADLVYRAGAVIADVDAWWLYFEMLKGLDDEIRAVRRYLDRRTSSQGRLSLQGVRGVTTPEETAAFIPTSGFLPIEINLRTGSIERLVQLLAGESLYGPDPMAAVRELIQNSRDAVMLKAATATTDFDRTAMLLPIRVTLRTKSFPPLLEITDSGVGMSRKVMTDYLISLASDYWTSQFSSDFPGATDHGFRPAGKFGIGFLSVFMLGDNVTVESNRNGGERYRLQLRGVGRRGDLRTVPSLSGSGTAVRVELRAPVVDSLTSLAELVRVHAPMLPHSLEVDVDGKVSSIPAGWLLRLNADEFYDWIVPSVTTLLRNRAGSGREAHDPDLWHFRRHLRSMWGAGTDKGRPWLDGWPEYQETGVRLLAGFDGVTVLSLRGLAVQPIATPGFVGVIDLESGTPDVSRRQVIRGDVTDVLQRATVGVRTRVVENLNTLSRDGLIIERHEFLANCVRLYGRPVILESSLRWISLLKLPGEVELVSCALLLERIRRAPSLFVAFGTGPWTAMKKWVVSGSNPVESEPAIVLEETSLDRLRYQSGSDEKVGTLGALWPNCPDTALFGTILQLVAEAWQIGPEDLCAQDGWRHSGSTLWGRFTR
jgi:hypothetical protein